MSAAVLSFVLVGALPVSAQTDERSAVRALLERRAAAVRENNENAFLATVDPRATDAFKNEQRTRFLGLRSVPLADYELTFTEEDSGDLSIGLGLDDKYRSNTFMPETREMFRLGPYDAIPMRNVFWYTYVERDDEWFVAALDDARIVGLDATPNVWDEGPVAAQTSPRVLVLSAPAQTDRARTVMTVAEKAMDLFEVEWPLPWSGRIPIVVPASPDQAARLLRTSTDVANFSAFTSYTPTRDDDWRASPPRLFAQEGNLSVASVQSQIDTIVHELTHAAAAPVTGPNTPIWMQEGLAEWIRLDKPTSVYLREGSQRRLPESSSFSTRDAGELSRAYNEATAAMAFLAAAKGSDAPIRLFLEAGKRKAVIGSPNHNADEAMRAATGWTTAEFVAAWQGR
jgi:hypothetical protein